MTLALRPVHRCLTATLLSVGLLTATPLAHAQRNSHDVKVSVSYEMSMDRPESATLLEDAMRQAREMVYSRVKLECEEMKRQFAQTCELTNLDIKQGAKKSRRDGKPGTLNIRANARYKVQLKVE